MTPSIRLMPTSTKCPICGEDVAIEDELEWAIVEVREPVKLHPPEFVPHLFYVHAECAKKARLLRDEPT